DDLHPEGLGGLVDDALDAQVELVPVAEQLIQFHFAKHAAQRGLRELRRLVDVVLHLDGGKIGLDDVERNHSIDLEGDVVARNHVLRRHFKHFLAQGNAYHLIERTKNENDAWSLRRRERTAKPEDHCALVVAQNLDGVQQIQNDNGDEDQGRD